LAKFISLLNEYVGFAGKVGKRLRDDKVTNYCLRSISPSAPTSKVIRTPCRRSCKSSKGLKAMTKERGFKSVSTRFDEEHNLWEVSYVSSQGRSTSSDGNSPRVRVPPDDYQVPPDRSQPRASVVVEHVKKVSAKAEEAEAEEETGDADAADVTVEEKPTEGQGRQARHRPRAVEKNTPRELLEYVLAEGKKDFIVQRYKGLGEMTAEQLWSTP